MKPALAATRTIQVLNFFTVNPNSVFTLSELSSALDVSPASMSAVLLSLTEGGYLVRHPRHKTYDLGPALVATGHAANARYPVVELARPQMPRLAALGAACIGTAHVGGDILVLAIEGLVTPGMREVRLGQRLPLVPPYGHSFLAWSSPKVIREWLAQLGPDEAARTEAEFERTLAFTRERGFAIALDNERVLAVQRLFDDLARHPWDPQLRARLRASIPEQTENYALGELDPARRYEVDHIASPVFGPDSTVIYVLSVLRVGSRTGAEILEIGRQLREVCLTLTREVGGRSPRIGLEAVRS